MNERRTWKAPVSKCSVVTLVPAEHGCNVVTCTARGSLQSLVAYLAATPKVPTRNVRGSP